MEPPDPHHGSHLPTGNPPQSTLEPTKIIADTSYAKAITQLKPQKPTQIANQIRFAKPRRTTHDGGYAVIFNHDDYYGSMALSCSHALVGKFLKQRPLIENLRARFKEKYPLKGDVQIGVFNYRTVFLDFTHEEDFQETYFRRVLELSDTQIWLQRWNPDFIPEEDIPLVPVWVNLPELPFHLHDWRILKEIVADLGTPLAPDAATVKRSRPGMAKVRVEINLTKPRIHSIWIGTEGNGNPLKGFHQNIEYEHIPKYCLHCKRLGHSNNECWGHEKTKKKKSDLDKQKDRPRQSKKEVLEENAKNKKEEKQDLRKHLDENRSKKVAEPTLNDVGDALKKLSSKFAPQNLPNKEEWQVVTSKKAKKGNSTIPECSNSFQALEKLDVDNGVDATENSCGVCLQGDAGVDAGKSTMESNPKLDTSSTNTQLFNPNAPSFFPNQIQSPIPLAVLPPITQTPSHSILSAIVSNNLDKLRELETDVLKTNFAPPCATRQHWSPPLIRPCPDSAKNLNYPGATKHHWTPPLALPCPESAKNPNSKVNSKTPLFTKGFLNKDRPKKSGVSEKGSGEKDSTLDLVVAPPSASIPLYTVPTNVGKIIEDVFDEIAATKIFPSKIKVEKISPILVGDKINEQEELDTNDIDEVKAADLSPRFLRKKSKQNHVRTSSVDSSTSRRTLPMRTAKKNVDYKVLSGMGK